MLPCRHVYLPYAEAARSPNIVVDGASNGQGVLTLSHWPKSGTPWPLKADTSVGIVFNYLDNPDWHRDVPPVTNNHFDEDGLVSVFCLIEPEHALARRDLLIEVSKAGDFTASKSREAARIAFAIARLGDRALSPWGADSFPRDYDEYCAFVYARLLGEFGALIEDVEGHRALWAEEDALLEASEGAFLSGEATIEERRDVDLAIVRVPAGWPDRPAHRYAQHLNVAIHRMAAYNRTACNRVALLCGNRVNFSYRYESWVQLVSHRPPRRVDLSPLAARLTEMDNVAWRFDGVEDTTPSLRPEGDRSSLDHERFLDALVQSLREGKDAWNPYDDPAA
jgi:hypothetical protein